jgi:hypothetical protein
MGMSVEYLLCDARNNLQNLHPDIRVDGCKWDGDRVLKLLHLLGLLKCPFQFGF